MTARQDLTSPLISVKRQTGPQGEYALIAHQSKPLIVGLAYPARPGCVARISDELILAIVVDPVTVVEFLVFIDMRIVSYRPAGEPCRRRASPRLAELLGKSS